VVSWRFFRHGVRRTSLAYFAVLAWLPALLRDNGIDAQRPGWRLSLVNLLGIATEMVTSDPGWTDDGSAAARHWSVCGLWSIGVVGLLVDPGLYIVWSDSRDWRRARAS